MRFLLLFLFVALSACGGATSQQGAAVEAGDQNAAAGKAIFRQHCSTCHLLSSNATGPALQGVLTRWDGDSAALRAYIRNPAKSIEQKEPHALKAWEQYKPTVMTPFLNLSDGDLNALIAYFQSKP